MDALTPMTTATAASLLPEWELAMTAENKSPLTIKVYVGAARQYLTWTTTQGSVPFELGTLNRWVADAMCAGRSGATARTRQLAVRRFAAWLLATGRLGDDPFRGVRTPKVEPPLVHPLPEDELRALLRTCDVADDARPDLLLQHRRDEAIIRLMLETAIRKGELTSLERGDVDLDAGLVTIRRGKGGRGRVIPIGPFANHALRDYLRQRARHPLAATPQLWLGTRSRPMGYKGLHNTLRRRARRLAWLRPSWRRHLSATLRESKCALEAMGAEARADVVSGEWGADDRALMPTGNTRECCWLERVVTEAGEVVVLGSEEVLDPTRGHDRQESAGLLGQVRHRMGNLARQPGHATGLEDAALLTDLVGQLSLQADDDLVLGLVHVERRTTEGDDSVDHRDQPVGLLAGHLQRQHRADAHLELLQ
jgi:integrase